MKRAFRKCILLTPRPTPPAFSFWGLAFQRKICCETTDFVVLAFTPLPSPWLFQCLIRNSLSRKAWGGGSFCNYRAVSIKPKITQILRSTNWHILGMLIYYHNPWWQTRWKAQADVIATILNCRSHYLEIASRTSRQNQPSEPAVRTSR